MSTDQEIRACKAMKIKRELTYMVCHPDSTELGCPHGNKESAERWIATKNGMRPKEYPWCDYEIKKRYRPSGPALLPVLKKELVDENIFVETKFDPETRQWWASVGFFEKTCYGGCWADTELAALLAACDAAFCRRGKE